MKRLIGFLPLLLMISVPAPAATLSFSIRGQSAVLVNESGISCVSRLRAIRENKVPLKDVLAQHFNLIDPRITFESDIPSQYARVSALQIRLESPELIGKSHQCIFESMELAGTFGMGTDYTWSGNIAANDTISVNPTCLALSCGGVKLVSPNATNFTAKLTLRLIGFIKDNRTNEERPIQAEFSNPAFRFSR
ncbi:MAG: hypothetical protein KF789_10545 [Bdellovibrionaceae bacterium]|nr:hypothetical protein [Pseudobdellovibrionaceae bacterium]